MNSDENSESETETTAFSGMALLVGDQWIDLASLLSALPVTEEEMQTPSHEQVAQLETLAEPLGKLALNLVADLLSPQAMEGQVTELPTAGLEALGIIAENTAA